MFTANMQIGDIVAVKWFLVDNANPKNCQNFNYKI
jgi:hypothetical protein